MPAQNIVDFFRVSEISKANVEMLATMHGALSNIARCEVSLDGGIAQKHIAETALIEVHEIANKLEVEKCRSLEPKPKIQ